MSASWERLLFPTVLLLASFRNIHTKTTGPTTPPMVPISPLPTDVRSVELKGKSHTEKVELLNPVELVLECTWSGDVNRAANLTGYWRKDGQEIENTQVTVQQQKEKYVLRRVFSIASKENLGNYSCLFENEAKVDFILAGPQIGEVRDKPIVSYVGDSVVIPCKMDETKPKPVSWNWYTVNGTEKEQIVVQPQRYEIEIKKGESKLLVHKLTEADSGLYYCEAVYAVSTTMAHVELRVITLLEPLKPFIVILVEVVLLVAAILLYERSQAKKGAAGGDNTNTDQTNTLTQGENSESAESSSVRQRKS
ncbi:embigin [Cynoglossus semilaevis]|uniref:Embigin n=1 Tax=Cynoglossus semilaevis TaxID=244447 RepID=A0A3P8WS89_CYNSE|nr:embigin [Cynoglossus semilaevis]